MSGRNRTIDSVVPSAPTCSPTSAMWVSRSSMSCSISSSSPTAAAVIRACSCQSVPEFSEYTVGAMPESSS